MSVLKIKDGQTWQSIQSLKGDPGQDGTDGHTPVKGTDYWTAQDQAAIVQDVLDALTDAEEVSF